MEMFKNLTLEGWFALSIFFFLVAAVVITSILSWIVELIGKFKQWKNKTQ
jgi:hypothetical protein